MKKAAIFIVALLALSVSCTDPAFVTKTYPVPPRLEATATHEQQVTYTQTVFDILGRAVGDASLNPQFRTFVYAEVDKAFDGETNVLITRLIDGNSSETSGLLYDVLSRKVGGGSQADQIIAAFVGVDNGRTPYPHLFIPFYRDLVRANKIGSSAPIIVPAALSDKPNLKGFRATESGLVELDFLIDEAFARANEVWVITMNERVDNEGQYPTPNHLGEANQRTKVTVDGRYNEMKINSHKESFAAGASEINTKRYATFYTYDYYSSGVPHSFNMEDPYQGEGTHIRDFSRSEIDDHDSVPIGWVYVADWPNFTLPLDGTPRALDYMVMTIFEYDPFPTGLNTIILGDYGNSGLHVEAKIRSADGPYHNFIIPRSIAASFIVNDGANTIYSTCTYN